MVIHDAPAAQALYCRSRFSAFTAKRRLERNQARPTFRTCPSPPALLNRSVTIDARDWEQEIENVVEQSAFWGNAKGERIVAKLVLGRNQKKGARGIFLLRVRKILDDRQCSVQLFQKKYSREIVCECQWRKRP